jgi:hypothetical protein
MADDEKHDEKHIRGRDAARMAEENDKRRLIPLEPAEIADKIGGRANADETFNRPRR